MKHANSIIAIIFMLILVIILSSQGLAERPTVTLWTIATCNKSEWHDREADLEALLNINLNIVMVAQNAFIQKLQATMMDGKDYPDIIEWMIENNRILSTDPKVCFVSPLEKYTAKSKVLRHVSPGRISYLTYGKHIYGLPHDVHPAILIYNDALWKSVGVDMDTIETWDDFFQAAVELSVERKDGKPVHYALPQNDGLGGTMFMIWQQSGAQILDKNGKPCFTSPAFREFLEKWLAWSKTGTMCNWDWGNFGSLLRNGSMAAFISPDWWVSQVNDAAKAGIQFRARPLPLYRKGGSPTASWGGSFLAICKLAKNQDFLYKVIETMQYDDPIHRNRYRDTGMLAPSDIFYDDESYHQPNPKFGSQKIGELQTQMALQIPAVQTGDIFWEAINDFNEQYTEIMAGRVSVDDGLRAAQAKAMARVK